MHRHTPCMLPSRMSTVEHAALQRTGGAGNLASSIKEILAEVDKDGDGRIDYQEFCDMMRGQAGACHPCPSLCSWRLPV